MIQVLLSTQAKENLTFYRMDFILAVLGVVGLASRTPLAARKQWHRDAAGARASC
jgi:hypothetical protein